jgi:RimJ/RimL family protein N-acetyltransferase
LRAGGWAGDADQGPDGEAPTAYELGYRLRPRWWGQGLATEGAAALVAHAFEDLGASCVWGQTMTVNTGSRRVMERCGLRYVETFFADWGEWIEGSEHGDVRYAIDRHDWLRARPRRGDRGG